ncbi:hypothetical protein [Lysinibacillus fusiformis]|uniref:hypothetical protein n=1 Tax=Lysinibacillus fusiformis TaxID=28031 RepID=UPI001E6026C2|nr:hypothetical protein [Lysinibacillus fusiformis]
MPGCQLDVPAYLLTMELFVTVTRGHLILVTACLVQVVSMTALVHVTAYMLAVAVRHVLHNLFVVVTHDAAVTLYENLVKGRYNVRTIRHSHNKNLQYELYLLLRTG